MTRSVCKAGSISACSIIMGALYFIGRALSSTVVVIWRRNEPVSNPVWHNICYPTWKYLDVKICWQREITIVLFWNIFIFFKFDELVEKYKLSIWISLSFQRVFMYLRTKDPYIFFFLPFFRLFLSLGPSSSPTSMTLECQTIAECHRSFCANKGEQT